MEKRLLFLRIIVLILLLGICISTTSAAQNSISTQTKNASLQMTTTLENSNTQLQFNYAENINDGRGITFGCIGFCTGTYDGSILIKYYTTLNPNNPLAKYIPALDAIDAGSHNAAGGDGNPDTTGLDGFIQDVQNCNDPLFKTAQLYELDQMYWNPAQSEYNALHGQYAITQALLYDATVREGSSGMQKLATQAEGGQAIDELTFDQNFINAYTAAVKKENLGDTDRMAGFQAVLNSGNYNLTTPFTFTAYGDQFTITGALGVGTSISSTDRYAYGNTSNFNTTNSTRNDGIGSISGNDLNSNGTVTGDLNSGNSTVTAYLHHKHSQRNHHHNSNTQVTNQTSEGYQAGYNAGYQAGYKAGKHDILKEIVNFINSLLSTTNNNSTVQQPVSNTAQTSYTQSDNSQPTNSQNIADTHQDESIDDPENSKSTVIGDETYYQPDSSGKIWSWKYDN